MVVMGVRCGGTDVEAGRGGAETNGEAAGAVGGYDATRSAIRKEKRRR